MNKSIETYSFGINQKNEKKAFSGLTQAEYVEFQLLKKQLFPDNVEFKEFPSEEENSQELKRYDELIRKKMNYLREQAS